MKKYQQSVEVPSTDSFRPRRGSTPVAAAKAHSTDGVKIGISGARGSFSEEAARAYARAARINRYELMYLISVEHVLTRLEKGTVQLGIFPIENSTGGVVREAIEAMAKHRFSIKTMFDINIMQNLMVKRGIGKKDVRLITSHDQALKQCRKYLKKHWSSVRMKEYEDTAKAAEDLAAGMLPPSTAVIASVAAAKIYGLKIIDRAIQDQKTNYTSFIAAVRR